MDNITIKNVEEIELMRESGRLLASVFKMLDEFIVPGISTMEINDKVESYIVNELQARPASKGQYGYQYVLNTSINEVVCHGVPKVDEILKPKDIINVDITLEKNGFIADSSKMYVMPEASPLARKLVKDTYNAMWEGIKQVKPGATLGDIGSAIQHHAESNGYSVVREYCGHGIGRKMHEDPQVLHYGTRGRGLVLKEGMTFTIEPMINQGGMKIKTKKDGWTVVTRDKKLSAQSEHTILVTKDGYEVLTLRDEER
ncbi:type I methionyl aminopeptidase [Providencia sp. PROV188]|jgi:methionyl aminopeptidase|uniref:type I methionyl aminopeptidase n=1 Tax=Providencia TaxID=586 RepID=UPI0003E22FDE|nr:MULTISPECIES: type I methionyl aminopeptidase [Providencia]ETS99594.1 methionine aminopeptidase, type I [Providencia alcalifaciens PAL-3]EUD00264.1 methionine aminopeptidase, type I [Providencia alcalifaciens PAL-1]MBG5881812.1 type I methionyl aminopeptidase [Providencia alcalifaciens]MDR2242978.1 type I methionyl aminopeptidase [Providencia alcalifaciens]MTB47326.1 type I methionyl aminopeptidase [Providencia sp. wls1950]